MRVVESPAAATSLKHRAGRCRWKDLCGVLGNTVKKDTETRARIAACAPGAPHTFGLLSLFLLTPQTGCTCDRPSVSVLLVAGGLASDSSFCLHRSHPSLIAVSLRVALGCGLMLDPHRGFL